MPKTTFTAIDPAGKTHKRGTARVYTHTVVAQKSKQAAIALAHTSRGYSLQTAREEFANAARSIEENKAFLIAKKCGILARDDKYATEMKTRGEVFVTTWGTPEAYADAVLAETLRKIEATDYSVWINQGWCGRPDLARNLQANCTKGGWYINATILPAVAK